MIGDGLGKIGPARDMKQILGEVILGETQQTLTDEVIEENMVTIIGVETGPERGHSQKIIAVSLEIEVQVVVDLGQDQGQVLIEIELNATSVENMNIS